MAADRSVFLLTVTAALAERMRELARAHCPSRTLRESMKVLGPERVQEGAKAAVFVPHYWAPMYHGGRGPSPTNPAPRRWIVYFKDKTLDPRTAGSTNYPVRLADARHLTHQEYLFWKKRGALIVRLQVGPARGHPFFDQAAPELEAAASADVPAAFSDLVRSMGLCSFERAVARL